MRALPCGDDCIHDAGVYGPLGGNDLIGPGKKVCYLIELPGNVTSPELDSLLETPSQHVLDHCMLAETVAPRALVDMTDYGSVVGFH